MAAERSQWVLGGVAGNDVRVDGDRGHGFGPSSVEQPALTVKRLSLCPAMRQVQPMHIVSLVSAS
jgi:hypothetical protein